MTGEHCRGIETWRIDDNTGAVTYEGSSLGNLSTQQPQRKLTDRARSDTPTNTPVRPTYTPVRPTKTPIPPTKTPIPPTKTPIPPTDCVRVETTDARLDSNSIYQVLHLQWRITNICNIPISHGQTIVFYDKGKNILGSQLYDSCCVRRLAAGESQLYRTFTGYSFAGGDAFHSYGIETPWKPD